MKTHFSIKFDSLVKEKCNEINKPIFVLVGLSEYIDLSLYCNNIVDTETFEQEGNGKIFSPEWFTRVFIRLSKDEDFYIFSHQQYSYLTEYLNPDLYKDRLVVVYDNITDT